MRSSLPGHTGTIVLVAYRSNAVIIDHRLQYQAMKTITSTVQLLIVLLASAKAFVPSRFAVHPTTNQQQFDTPSVRIAAPFGIQSRQPCGSLLFMGWGPEPIWSAAEVKTNEAANQSGKCVSLKVVVPPSAAEEYTIPGQYVQFRLNEDTKPLFLAIASAPSKENAEFEFLIKKTDDNGWITNAPAGTKVEISQVLGGGFPMKDNLEGFKYDFPTQNILLFSAGSGIAPIKAAMESGQLNVAATGGGGRTARLYYGVQTADDLCFVSKFPEWESLGFQIVPVLSQPSPEWNGRTGYVQNCLEEDGVPIPRNSGALLCGQKGMAESVKAILTQAGVFEGRVLTNF
jgi:NAD(P)H-flavin reductase